jgi:hypothetical protein
VAYRTSLVKKFEIGVATSQSRCSLPNATAPILWDNIFCAYCCELRFLFPVYSDKQPPAQTMAPAARADSPQEWSTKASDYFFRH